MPGRFIAELIADQVALWARLVDARRNGIRFPLLAAFLILGSAWLFLGVLEDVATGDPLVDVDVIVLRFLSVDAVQKANSGHPGMPLRAAPMAYAEFSRQLPASAVGATVRQRTHS